MVKCLALFVVLTILHSGFPPALWAAETMPSPGTTVRVTFPCELLRSSVRGECRDVGRLARWDGDSLSVAFAETTGTMRLADLIRLEASAGKKSHRGLGAGLGFVLGAGLTYLILESGGSTSPCDQNANQDAMSNEECWGITALGGAAGAGLGFVVGGLFQSDRWKEVPLGK